jgi:DNA-directed RNA polymerase subunit RPC12/RpoP
MTTIVLDCQKCGGSLTITEDLEIFKCEYCSTPYMVKREGGATRIIRLEQRVDQLEDHQVLLKAGVSALSQINDIKAQREKLEKEISQTVNPDAIVGGLMWGIGSTIVFGLCSFGSLTWRFSSQDSPSSFLTSVGCISGLLALFFGGVTVASLVIRPVWAARKRKDLAALCKKQSELESRITDAST